MLSLYARMQTALWAAGRKVEEFYHKEDGAIDFVALAIILVITVTLAILFRKQLASLFSKIWGSISGKTGSDFEINGLE